jgi:hypothetical protein
MFPTLNNLEKILQGNDIYWFNIRNNGPDSYPPMCIIIEIPKFHYLFKMKKVKKIIKNEFLPAGIVLLIIRKH